MVFKKMLTSSNNGEQAEDSEVQHLNQRDTRHPEIRMAWEIVDPIARLRALIS